MIKLTMEGCWATVFDDLVVVAVGDGCAGCGADAAPTRRNLGRNDDGRGGHQLRQESRAQRLQNHGGTHSTNPPSSILNPLSFVLNPPSLILNPSFLIHSLILNPHHESTLLNP